MKIRGAMSEEENGGVGRSWTRAEDRLALRNRQTKRPRDLGDLRNKLKLKASDKMMEECHFVKPETKFKQPAEREEDPEVLQRRAKQIEYGKNNLDYERYTLRIRKEDRAQNMPRTPNKYRKYSRRQWDGLIKSWKQSVHRIGQSLIKSEEEPFQIGNWADECDAEFPDLTDWDRRPRSQSMASSDQGLGSSVCNSGVVTPRSLSGCLSPTEDMKEENPS